MTLFALLYIVLTLGGVAALAAMILRIGTMLGDCPQSRATARAAAVTIATGFAAIGTGGVILIGAGLPLLANVPFAGFLGITGLAALCLGLGFTHAVHVLRALMQDAGAKAA
ncbi:hypothetical protein KDD17_11620 [Sulfitobacter albidus]|uniref:Uncharacterized protein n=1 Tax=Sulfitobacter albidus TaxID=2829501 RepID=A0A975PLB3_9RHOB|nr:hypothetical protein [Sulfitobacter albidus]QUJ75602.1 hypothetical protein KDD17_11620 [Sulfitobacter albidus]